MVRYVVVKSMHRIAEVWHRRQGRVRWPGMDGHGTVDHARYGTRERYFRYGMVWYVGQMCMWYKMFGWWPEIIKVSL